MNGRLSSSLVSANQSTKRATEVGVVQGLVLGAALEGWACLWWQDLRETLRAEG